MPHNELERAWNKAMPYDQDSKLSVLSVRQPSDFGTLPPLVPAAPTLPSDLLPDSLRPWLHDVAERAQVPIEMVAAPAIVGLGSIIGRTVGIHPKRRDNWIVVPNLWGGVIARPGTLKSHATAEALKPLRKLATVAQEEHKQQSYDADADKMVIEAQITAVKEELKKAAKKADPDDMEQHKKRLSALQEQLDNAVPYERRYMTTDPTIEKLGELLNQNPRGLLLSRDELSGWFRSLAKTGREGDREFYLESWNGDGGYDCDRIGRGTIHIAALTLSVYGTMQPGKLKSYINGALGGGAGDDGLLQRFQILVWPESAHGYRNVDRSPDLSAAERANDIFHVLDTELTHMVSEPDFSDGIPAIRFCEEAQELFDAWRTDLEVRLRSDDLETAPAFTSHLAKYRSLMPSLALIFHLVETVPNNQLPPVSLQAAQRAAAWCEYLERHARKIYATELNPDLAAAHSLMDKIKTGRIENGMKIRDVYRSGWSGLSTPEQVTGGFYILARHDIASIAEVSTGGNPAEVIQLHGVE